MLVEAGFTEPDPGIIVPEPTLMYDWSPEKYLSLASLSLSCRRSGLTSSIPWTVLKEIVEERPEACDELLGPLSSLCFFSLTLTGARERKFQSEH